MIRWFISNRLNAAEKKIGVSLEYLREMLATAPPIFFKFLKLKPLATHRRVLPPSVLHVARIVATRHHDCGACVQMAVNHALQEGLSPELLQLVLDQHVELLPEALAAAYGFAESVVTRDGEDEEWRERVRRQFGDEGVVELSLAVAVSAVFPTMKRGMGYAASCDWRKIRSAGLETLQQTSTT